MMSVVPTFVVACTLISLCFGGPRDHCEVPKTSQKDIPCNQHKLCGSCTRQKNCGWCGSSQKCMDGSGTGPKNGVCEAGTWDYEFCLKEPCSVYTSCRACTGDPFCGWCPSERTCSDGKQQTPTSGFCPDWAYGKCPLECSQPENEITSVEISEAPGIPAGTLPTQNRVPSMNVIEEEDAPLVPPSDPPAVKPEKCETPSPCGVGKDCKIGSPKDMLPLTIDEPPPSLDKRDMPEPVTTKSVTPSKVAVTIFDGKMSKSRMNAGSDNIIDLPEEEPKEATAPAEANCTRGTRKQSAKQLTENQRRLTSPEAEDSEDEDKAKADVLQEETEEAAVGALKRKRAKPSPSPTAKADVLTPTSPSFGVNGSRTAKIPYATPIPTIMPNKTITPVLPPPPPPPMEEAIPLMDVEDDVMNYTIAPAPGMPDFPPPPKPEPEEDKPIKLPEEKQEPEPEAPSPKIAKCVPPKELQLPERPAIKMPEVFLNLTMPEKTSGNSETPQHLPSTPAPTPLPPPKCKKCAPCQKCPGNPCPDNPPCNITAPPNITRPVRPTPLPTPFPNKTASEEKRWTLPPIPLQKPPAVPVDMLPPLPPAALLPPPADKPNITNVTIDAEAPAPPAPDEMEPEPKPKRKCLVPPPITDIEDVITKEGRTDEKMEKLSPEGRQRGVTNYEMHASEVERNDGDVSVIMPDGPKSHSNSSTQTQKKWAVPGKIPMPHAGGKVVESTFMPQHSGLSEQFVRNTAAGMPGLSDPAPPIPEMHMPVQEEQYVRPKAFMMTDTPKTKEMPDTAVPLPKGPGEITGMALNMNSVSPPMSATDMNADDDNSMVEA